MYENTIFRKISNGLLKWTKEQRPSVPIQSMKRKYTSVMPMVSTKGVRVKREQGGEDGDAETWREKW